MHHMSRSRGTTDFVALMAWVALLLGMRSLILGVKVVSDGPIYHLYFALGGGKPGDCRWWRFRSEKAPRPISQPMGIFGSRG